jgi:hypothetical protein
MLYILQDIPLTGAYFKWDINVNTVRLETYSGHLSDAFIVIWQSINYRYIPKEIGCFH